MFPLFPLPENLRTKAFFASISISLFLVAVFLIAGASLSLSVAIFFLVWLIFAFLVSPFLLLSILILLRSSIDALSDISFSLANDTISITTPQFFGIGVFALAILFVVFYKKPSLRNPLFLPFVLFILWGFLTLFYSVNPSFTNGTGYELVRLSTILFLFLLAKTAVRTPTDWRRLLLVIVASAILPLLFAVFQISLEIGYRDDAFNIPRAFGTFAHPNVFAMFFVSLVAVAFLLVEKASSMGQKITGVLLGALSSIAVLLSFTRIAWLALAILVAMLFIRKSLRWLPILFLMGFLLYVAVEPVQERVNEAFTFSSGNSLVWRFGTWSDATTATIQSGRALFGSGLNTFSTVLENIRGIRFTVNDPHSEFIRAFVEGGIVGLLVLIAFYATILVTLFRTWKQAHLSPEGRSVFFALFTLWVALTIASLTDHILRSTPLQWVVWSLMGGAFAVFLPKEKKENENIYRALQTPHKKSDS